MFTEAELLPLSALQHLAFCERQCALIHLERLWRDNRLTAEGHRLHRNAHDQGGKSRDGTRTARGLEVRSYQLGLMGVCDVVLWEPPDDLVIRKTIAAAWREATPEDRRRWKITPVEYKRGKPKTNECDRVQLCGQALCLEEMLDISIPAGQIFYGKTRRRTDVVFDASLRTRTMMLTTRLHELFGEKVTPPALYEKTKCDSCSLKPDCLPELTLQRASARNWFERQLENSLQE